ncbi:hypothetical protein [Arthrobacter sp. JSM 101049]|uniref:hypothetical protein n=1 Tax=Arthrobacter sp. JSM 101049 TaxID=929097 RepID=UPI003566640E
MSPAVADNSARTTHAGPAASRSARLLNRTGVRLLFLVPGGLALLTGLNAALVLLGLPHVPVGRNLAASHGMLMVFGFIGTVIALERSVALGRLAGFAAPALLGLGGLALVSPLPQQVGKGLLFCGCVALAGVYLPLWKRQREVAVLIQILGAVAGIAATMLWLRIPDTAPLIPLLAVFVVLTIAGERLELARIHIHSPVAEPLLTGLSTLLLASGVGALLWPRHGLVFFGAVLGAIVVWLAVYDVARHTIRSTGLPRYIAGCLLAGYGWLAVAAVISTTAGIQAEAITGSAYDALTHAVFLGFTMSMIMAHAPVILPAVLRHPLPYRPILVLPATLLHASLCLRIFVADVLDDGPTRQFAGVVNIAAVVLFAALAAGLAASARQRAGRAAPAPGNTLPILRPQTQGPAARKDRRTR